MLDTAPKAPAGETRLGWWSGKTTQDRVYVIALAAAVLVGVAVRAYHILHYSFPLNDGGLFYQMVRDLQHANYRLPSETTYNNAQIPFGYPPLGLYVAAILDALTPLSLIDTFRLIPFLGTSLTIIAFLLLARRLLDSRLALVTAVVAFALVPRSFIWLLMGGGVTRSLGLLFALLALQQLHVFYSNRDWRFAVSTSVLAALTVLSHLETGFFLAFSCVVMFAFYGRDRRTLLWSVAIGAGVVVLTAPWWLTVVAQDGLGPLRDANSSGGSIFTDGASRQYVALSLARAISSSEPYFPLIGAVGLLGGLAALFSRRFFLPVWWLVTLVLDPRAFPTFTTVPVAMLAGIGLAEFVLPALRSLGGRIDLEPHANSVRGVLLDWTRQPAAWLIFVGFGFALVGSLITSPGLAGEGVYLHALTPGERDTMAFIKQSTPTDSRFLVVPRGSWETDKESEWFPVLAGRQSVATVQGYEWTADFNARQDQFWAAFNCGFRTTTCLDQWVTDSGEPFTGVYIPRENGGQCCTTLVQSLNEDPRYQVLTDGPGGTVWQVVGVIGTHRAPPAHVEGLPGEVPGSPAPGGHTAQVVLTAEVERPRFAGRRAGRSKAG